MICTGTDQSKHSPCQSCRSASVAEPQGKYLQSGPCHRSPEALKGLCFLCLSPCLCPLGFHILPAPQHVLVQGAPLAPRGSALCWCLCLQRGAGRGAGSPKRDCCWVGTVQHIRGCWRLLGPGEGLNPWFDRFLPSPDGLRGGPG